MTDLTIDQLGDGDDWAGYEPPSDKVRPPEPKEYTFVLSLEEEGVVHQPAAGGNTEARGVSRTVAVAPPCFGTTKSVITKFAPTSA